MADSSFRVLIATFDRVIFEGDARSLILPGERGVFEVLPFHRKLLSRLVEGKLLLDGQSFPIKRGVAKVSPTEVTVIIEEVR